MQITASKPLIL